MLTAGRRVQKDRASCGSHAVAAMTLAVPRLSKDGLHHLTRTQPTGVLTGARQNPGWQRWPRYKLGRPASLTAGEHPGRLRSSCPSLPLPRPEYDQGRESVCGGVELVTEELRSPRDTALAQETVTAPDSARVIGPESRTKNELRGHFGNVLRPRRQGQIRPAFTGRGIASQSPTGPGHSPLSKGDPLCA